LLLAGLRRPFKKDEWSDKLTMILRQAQDERLAILRGLKKLSTSRINGESLGGAKAGMDMFGYNEQVIVVPDIVKEF
jgi:hypothetical protein